MPRLMLGLLAGALGAAILAAAGYGFLNADALSASPGDATDPLVWLSHWRRSTGTYALLGFIMIVGAVLILRNNGYGLLLIAAAFAAGATFQWLPRSPGEPRFSFETPNSVESILLGGGAVFCVLLFLQRDKLFARK